MVDSVAAPVSTAATAPVIVAKQTVPDNRPLQPNPSSAVIPPFPNPSSGPPQPPSISGPPPPSIQPSFRPAAPPVPVPSAAATPQFSPVTCQAPGVPPPGVIQGSTPAVGSGAPPQVMVASVQPVITPPYAMAGQPVRYAPPMPNGYPAIPQSVPQGVMPPPGIPRYPSPYAPMIRTVFPPRPLVGVMPPIVRSPVVGIRGPIIPPIVRPPVVLTVAPAEKPQTTVYVGKISSTVENDFMLSLLQLCGPVKSWKRPQDPTGALKGFGFCEFESAEGVLRAMRLLNKLNVDGQELMLNVNQTTREYLVRYVEKKMESSKNNKEVETGGDQKEDQSASSADVKESVKASEELSKSSLDEQKKDETEMEKKVNPESAYFGLVTEEDRGTDCAFIEKLASMLEERLRSKPLPPPPPPPQQTAPDGPSNSISEQPSRLTDKESDGGIPKSDLEDKNEDEKTAESRSSSENGRTEMSSPDRSRRRDRSRDRDRELRREKERELERYERDREQERAKREKERDHKSWEDERKYKAREKEWETREREKEHRRKREREREKERAQERKWGIIDQERDSDDGYGKKRKYRVSDEERKRRQREKEEDLADRLREEEEIVEAKAKVQEEEQKEQHEVLKLASGQSINGQEKDSLPKEIYFENQNKATEHTVDQKANREIYEGEGVSQNGVSSETVVPSDNLQNNNAPAKKLGFGLSGSGKRAAVPSVFNEDEDEDAHKEKKMRPLVPIDYSADEQQAVQPSISEGPSANVLAASEFAKHISIVNPKEEITDAEKEKGRRSHDRSSQRDRDRHVEETNSTREEVKRDNVDRERANKVKKPGNFLDAKQLIDTIPKTKNELFSYCINWSIYDQNALHERMRPWISKKIMDFLGEEEVTLVDYIVSSIQEHVDAREMLDRLQAILDDEAEMFVLKMWRMLIFEIKRVETGLAVKSRA